MTNDLSSRIKECMAASNINNEQLAKACGVSPPTSFHWASGKTKRIKAEPLFKAAKLFGVTPEWLDSGSFPKFSNPEKNNEINQNISQYRVNQKIDPLSIELLNLFDKLSKPHKHEFISRLRGFVEGINTHNRGSPVEQNTPANNERTGTHA